MLIESLVAAMQLAPTLSEAELRVIKRAQNPTEIIRAQSAKCGDTEYSIELRSEFSGSGTKLLRFDRRPTPVNDWTRETIAAAFDAYSDVFGIRFYCGVEREGVMENFLLLDISGYSRADTDDASEQCRQKSGVFSFDTHRLIDIAEDHAVVTGSEVGSCVTEESIRENRRLNEGPEL